MAEAVFRSLTNNLPPVSPSAVSKSLSTAHPQISYIDSAGTGAYHTLDPPDARTLATLHSHSIHGYTHCARKITAEDFSDFDYIFAMDRNNLRDLKAMKMRVDKRGGVPSKAKVRLFGEFGGKSRANGRRSGEELAGEEVVDPYYGADNGFEVVFEQVDRFSRAFLRMIGEDGKGLGKGGIDRDGS